MEESNIFSFEKSVKLPEKNLCSILEWKGNLISAHIYPFDDNKGVYITTKSESKRLWNERCYSLCIWKDNLVCGGYKVISIWNSNEELIMELKGNIGYINCVIEWNEYLVSGSNDNTIRIWNLNGNCERILNGHTDEVYCLLIWNNHLVSGSFDKTIRIWNLNGDCLMILNGHSNGILSLLIFNNNLISGFYDTIFKFNFWPQYLKTFVFKE